MVQRQSKKDNLMKYIILILFIIFVLLLSIFLIFSVFYIYERMNTSSKTKSSGAFLYKLMEYNKNSNFSKSSIVQLPKKLSREGYISYFSNKQYFVISHNSENYYECEAICYCTASTKRRSAVSFASKSLVFVVSAISLTLAIQLSSEFLKSKCIENYNSQCASNLIIPSVPKCELKHSFFGGSKKKGGKSSDDDNDDGDTEEMYDKNYNYEEDDDFETNLEKYREKATLTKKKTKEYSDEDFWSGKSVPDYSDYDYDTESDTESDSWITKSSDEEVNTATRTQEKTDEKSSTGKKFKTKTKGRKKKRVKDFDDENFEYRYMCSGYCMFARLHPGMVSKVDCKVYGTTGEVVVFKGMSTYKNTEVVAKRMFVGDYLYPYCRSIFQYDKELLDGKIRKYSYCTASDPKRPPYTNVLCVRFFNGLPNSVSEDDLDYSNNF